MPSPIDDELAAIIGLLKKRNDRIQKVFLQLSQFTTPNAEIVDALFGECCAVGVIISKTHGSVPRLSQGDTHRVFAKRTLKFQSLTEQNDELETTLSQKLPKGWPLRQLPPQHQIADSTPTLVTPQIDEISNIETLLIEHADEITELYNAYDRIAGNPGAIPSSVHEVDAEELFELIDTLGLLLRRIEVDLKARAKHGVIEPDGTNEDAIAEKRKQGSTRLIVLLPR